MQFGVKVDYSKPDLMRSPWYDPFFKKDGEIVKRKADHAPYIKRGVKQADYTIATVYAWNEYDPEDLYIKQSNMNDICFDPETGEILNETPVKPLSAYSISDINIIQGSKTPRGSYTPAASTSLFDQLREECYPLYSKKKIWGYYLVLSVARQLGEGQSEKRITDTARRVFEWIEKEFPKSHDASKAANGKGTLWANIRWLRERMKKQLLVDFANKEGFSRQYAHKLKKAGKVYDQFGKLFYTKNKIDCDSYVKKFDLVIPIVGDKASIGNIDNKHVNHFSEDIHLFENTSQMSHVEIEIPPPIPPPRAICSYSTRELVEMWF